MRILCLAQAFLPVVGGAERFLDQLARRLCERGHEVTVVAARSRRGGNRVEAPYRLIRYRKPFLRRALARWPALHLWRAARTGRPDCLHAHGAYPPGYAAELYARKTGVPWVVRPMGIDVLPGEHVRADPTLDARLRVALRGADRVVAQSADMEEVVAGLGVEPRRIVRIPNGVDAAEFARPLASPSPGPLVTAMGHFSPKKGFDVLVDAFAIVRRRFPDARLAILGEGSGRAALEERIRAAGSSEAIELPGVLQGDAKVAALQRAWLFVSSARREPFSNANLEALAAGLPLVATRVGGNPEMVDEGRNGLLVPPEDAPATAAAIARLLEDPGLRARMGAAARAKAGEYAWAGVIDRYESLYREVAGERA